MMINGNGVASFSGACIKRVTEYAGDTHDNIGMLVWNEIEQKTQTIWYAHTGYGSSYQIAEVDATPEVLAKAAEYAAMCAAAVLKLKRNAKANSLRAFRASMLKAAKQNGVPYVRMFRLNKLYTEKNVEKLMILMTSNIRSNFKISLRTQLVSWLNDAAPKYKTPLSPKQMDYV